MHQSGPLSALYADLRQGRLSRREFFQRATALGLSAATAGFAIKALDMRGASAQDATPTPVSAGRPSFGMENVTRGQGGELRILIWQAPTHLSPHNATGDKDYLAASFVVEPLMHYLPDSTLTPALITEVPTVDNGLLAEDFTSVTYTLLPNVVWSDGEPFTARDVEFTWKWIMDPANAAVTANIYEVISGVEVIDDLTVKVTFASPTFAWYVPFTGGSAGVVLPGHLWGFDPTNRSVNDSFRSAPIGTGPYIVDTFSENDQATYSVNELFREPNKPYFATVNLKGGGDAASAARAVLQTGDFDYAWNLQVEPAVLNDLIAAGNGTVNLIPGTSVEGIFINFSDPETEVDGERSHVSVPHPILTEKAVRQALASAIDRETIATQLYSEGEVGTPNRLVGIPMYESPNTSFVFDTAAAAQMLEDAGWVLDGSIRKKGDLELRFTYSTTINAVRQKTQAIVKDNLSEIGVEIDLKQVDAAIYFDSAAGNDQNYPHFYDDLTMFTNGPVSPFPLDYMSGHYAGPENVNVAQKANEWSGNNFSRYVNPEYDALWEEAQVSLDPERVAELFIAMNDLLIGDAAIIPLVQRAGSKSAVSNRLNLENMTKAPFEGDFWNIMNWVEVQG